MMYNLIEGKRSVRKLYTESLIGRGDISVEEAEAALRDYSDQLERVFSEVREATRAGADDQQRSGLEVPSAQAQDEAEPEQEHSTAIPVELVHRVGDAFVSPPDGFTPHPKLAPLLSRRQQMSREGGIDWAFGELIAFGSLVAEGTPVRLAGQDSRRGTFVQRHAVVIDRRTGEEWAPVGKLGSGARFWAHDSLLSEFAAMGFEYGYSVERPDALVLWEAQFADFVNGAQTIIDEFISAGEQKWGQRSSVVLLLPHGYEGQGPDHSSGRIERFLQMVAEDNMTVAVPSTPASYFHLLRRQAYAKPRRPLVVFTPKSMLRLKAATSSVEEFTTGTFQPVVQDASGRPVPGRPGPAVRRQGLLRPRRRAGQARGPAHRHRPGRAARPAARRGADGGGARVPRGRIAGLGAGGAGEPRAPGPSSRWGRTTCSAVGRCTASPAPPPRHRPRGPASVMRTSRHGSSSGRSRAERGPASGRRRRGPSGRLALRGR